MPHLFWWKLGFSVVWGLFAAWVAMVSLFVAGMKCDETCEDGARRSGVEWDQYADSAQWDWIGLLGVSGFVSAVVAFILLLRLKMSTAAKAFGVSVGCALIALLLIFS